MEKTMKEGIVVRTCRNNQTMLQQKLVKPYTNWHVLKKMDHGT